MTQTQTIRTLATTTTLPAKTVAAVFDELARLARREAPHGFVVPGVGKLLLSHRKARVGRNPQTGEPLKIPAKRVCKFRLLKGIKDAVLAGAGA